jgi:hypothetical protein
MTGKASGSSLESELGNKLLFPPPLSWLAASILGGTTATEGVITVETRFVGWTEDGTIGDTLGDTDETAPNKFARLGTATATGTGVVGGTITCPFPEPDELLVEPLVVVVLPVAITTLADTPCR